MGGWEGGRGAVCYVNIMSFFLLDSKMHNGDRLTK